MMNESRRYMKNLFSGGSKLFVIAAALILLILLSLFLPLIASQNITIQQNRICGEASTIEPLRMETANTPDTPLGVTEVYTLALPEHLADDAHLAFYTVHQFAEVYINDSIVYRQTARVDRSVIKTTGCNWAMFPLSTQDAGKTLKVVITPVYESFRNQEVEFLLGSALDIHNQVFREDMFVIVLCVLMVFIGLIFLIFASFSMHRYNSGKSLLLLGLSAVMVGLWKLLDTRFSPFLFPNRPLFWYYLSLVLLMFCLLPLYKSMSRRFSFISPKTINTYIQVSIVISVIQLLLQVFGIYDLRETLFITHLMILAGVIIVFVNVIIHHRQTKLELQKTREGAFLLLLFLGAITDLFLFYIRNSSSGLIFTMAAFLLYFSFAGVKLLINFIQQEQTMRKDAVRLAEAERQLTQSRMVSMTGQIRAHFIFNVLNAISALCKYDPEKADETVVRFARFLRTNINILEDDRPIPFENALSHLEDYIALEQIRFGNRVHFETDIQYSDFMIPPLIMQPIVENSVKHGLTATATGGLIQLKTWRAEDIIYIRIRDNGTGFDTSTDPGEESTGLRNIRFRLKHVANGDMQIDSTPGEGTTVTLTIPCTEVS